MNKLLRYEYHRIKFHWKKWVKIFHISLPHPLKFGMTIKYSFFTTPLYLIKSEGE